ncbi:MAG: LPS-assembly protein LptD, partial [Thermodesulfobacteriota bacterium]
SDLKGNEKKNEDTAKTPVFIGGDEIKRTGKGQYDMKNGFFTICSFGHPHFRFQSSNVRLFKTEQHAIVSTKNNVFYAENIPLMYIPFNFSFDANRRKSFLKSWDTGKSSRFGSFIKTDWDLYNFAFGEKLGEWSDLTLSLDYLDKRGPAAGLDFEYTKPDYFGYMNTYYINDDVDTDINNVPVKNNNRGHFLWRHRQFLPYDWRADIEIAYVADRSYYREFHEPQFKQEKDRETILYLRKIYDNKGITLLARKQLRSYDTLVDSKRLNRTNETLPELKYRIIGEPLWKDRLNFTSENELAFQDRVIDGIQPKKAEERFLGRGALLTAERVFDRVPVRLKPKDTVRFDTNNTINAPFHLWSQRFNPYIGARFTGYSESISTDPVTGLNKGDGAARGRIAIPLGLDTSTTLSRTYSIYNKFLNINRLRHILMPEVRLAFIPIVSQDPEDLNQFDGTDALDTYQSVRFGVRNRFQTKFGETGGEAPIDFASFNIAFNLFPGNAGLNRKLSDYIELDLMLRLSDKLRFLSENNEFNLDKGAFDVVNLGLGYDYMPKWNFFVRSRFIDNISSSVALSSEYSLSEKWRIGFFEQYEFRSVKRIDTGNGIKTKSQNLATRFVLSRYFHEWIGNITFDVNETRSNNIARFDIIPRGAKPTVKRFWF